jgi:hypothetical protein
LAISYSSPLTTTRSPIIVLEITVIKRPKKWQTDKTTVPKA